MSVPLVSVIIPTYNRASIVVHAVDSEENYAVVLHELGHLVGPDGDSRQCPHVKTTGTHSSVIAPSGEIGAWRWAAATALVWTRDMQDCLFESLQTYRDAATFDERFAMSMCSAEAALRITDRPLTFGELREQSALLRGSPATGGIERGGSPRSWRSRFLGRVQSAARDRRATSV